MGTQLPFDRLVRLCEDAQRKVGFDVVYQVGLGGYKPVSGTVHEVLSRGAFEEILGKSDLVITHAGIGSIVSCLALGKPIVVVPRLARHGEHRNDHQMATANAVKGTVLVANSADDIVAFIEALRSVPLDARSDAGTLNADFGRQLTSLIES